ncbi:MurR/RpiR family transcriptional regulator [Marinovum sp.]|uniref:MurR/RpiR family transcriptional regulator n=1 Tax=Marinovum sp. TaxID=2024839 RepID=UPI002B27AFC8|nr:MurR/RpiR family transcriptional regulator [Marinovum sp.]
MPDTIEDRISAEYPTLSGQLRRAADFVAANPVDVATRSLRAMAQSSGVSPATFSRLARTLGFEDYESLRETQRAAMGERLVPYAQRAEELRRGDQAPQTFLHRQAGVCSQNIALLERTISGERLSAAVDALHDAGKVLLVGLLGSAGIADYICYQAQYFARNWAVAGRSGSSLAASFASMSPGDAVIVLTKAPYARDSIRAAQVARANGFRTIVLTDSHTCPALEVADHPFIVPSQTANFFSSYTATLVLIETMMSMLVSRVGPEAEARIRATEEQTRQLTEV